MRSERNEDRDNKQCCHLELANQNALRNEGSQSIWSESNQTRFCVDHVTLQQRDELMYKHSLH